jgi:acyl carrier protein
MNKNGQTLARLYALIGRACQIDTASISRKSNLLGYAIDSIRMMDMLLSVEEDFEIQLQPADLDHIRTVGELADYIEMLISTKNAGKVTVISGATSEDRTPVRTG